MRLNLPPAELKIEEREGVPYVFDILRKRSIKLTPEEWVRQHFVHYLIEEKGFPQGLLANEVSLSLGSTTKRCDTVVYDLHALPQMIIEYKAPSISLSQKVFDQISRYNLVLRVPYLIVSNGLQHFCCLMNYSALNYRFLREIPRYEELVTG